MKAWSDFLFMVEHHRPRLFRAGMIGFISFIGLFWTWIVFFSGI